MSHYSRIHDGVIIDDDNAKKTGMSSLIHLTRSPQGDPLDAESLATLRALIPERGARRLSVALGVSPSTVERAAAGGIILRGSRALILAGLKQLSSERVR